jgi:hypothetical protein
MDWTEGELCPTQGFGPCKDGHKHCSMVSVNTLSFKCIREIDFGGLINASWSSLAQNSLLFF